MDVTSAINSLGTDYVSKVSQAMQDSATGSTAKTDSTFDSIYNASAFACCPYGNL